MIAYRGGGGVGAGEMAVEGPRAFGEADTIGLLHDARTAEAATEEQEVEVGSKVHQVKLQAGVALLRAAIEFRVISQVLYLQRSSFGNI